MSTPLKTRTTMVVLFQGDDLDPITDRALEVQKVAQSTAPRRLGDADTPLADATRSFDDFMEDANGRAVKVGLGALPRKAYGSLRNEHPPRMVQTPEGGQDVHADDGHGFNLDTFGDELVPLCIQAYWKVFDEQVQAAVVAGEDPPSTTAVRFESDAAVSEFLDSLSDGDWSKVYSAAWMLNQSPGPDPKVRLSSHLAPTSDETSTSPARLA